MSGEEGIHTVRCAGYELVMFWHHGSIDDPHDRRDMNIDIEIRTGAGRFSATVFTLDNVATLLQRWRASGERPNAYFRVPDAVIVDGPITTELLRALADEAVATGDIGGFERLDGSDDGAPRGPSSAPSA
jgi:hypothetical protein